MPWGDDPTDQMATPAPRPVEAHLSHTTNRRDTAMIACLVLLTFLLGTITMLSATYTLTSTIDRLMSAPICREVK